MHPDVPGRAYVSQHHGPGRCGATLPARRGITDAMDRRPQALPASPEQPPPSSTQMNEIGGPTPDAKAWDRDATGVETPQTRSELRARTFAGPGMVLIAVVVVAFIAGYASLLSAQWHKAAQGTAAQDPRRDYSAQGTLSGSTANRAGAAETTAVGPRARGGPGNGTSNGAPQNGGLPGVEHFAKRRNLCQRRHGRRKYELSRVDRRGQPVNSVRENRRLQFRRNCSPWIRA